ncbi:MAG: hypothetical protein JNN26_07285 [Candidatus Obscuribacter sp.]|nr:hypothetical protein [Candidatus Obscuribacter sp.]
MNIANDQGRSERLELLIVGRVLLTLGVASLTLGAAIASTLMDGIGPVQRGIIGLIVAASMVGSGETLSRRPGRSFLYWFSTNLMSAGYALAYFFVFSLYYVPGLTVLSTPYASWVLGLVLALLATYHGTRNPSMRWVTPVFTMLVTGHAGYQMLTSTATIELFAVTMKVQVLGCLIGMVWCSALSTVYKQLEGRYNWPGSNVTEAADWLFNRSAHEIYFVAAALNAMALPLFLDDRSQAPIWWSLEAPILLAISWRTANTFKHAVISLIWGVAIGNMLITALQGPVSNMVQLAVPLAGLAMGMMYRFYQAGTISHSQRKRGYQIHTYLAMALFMLVPYLHTHELREATPYWMLVALLITGAGLALRDKSLHRFGSIASMLSLFLFANQSEAWTWSLVGPVIICAYALSVAYSFIARKDGWRQTDFLPVRFAEYTVTREQADHMQKFWSWAGTIILLLATYRLNSTSEAVVWWSVEALVLTAIGVFVHSAHYRYQSYLAFTFATVKLWWVEVYFGYTGQAQETAFTLYRAYEFAVLGLTAILASYLLHREKDLLVHTNPASGTGSGGNPAAGPDTVHEDEPNQED